MTELIGPRVGVVGIPGRWSTEILADAFFERTGFRMIVDLGQVDCDLARGRASVGQTDLASLDALVVKKVDRSYGWSNLDRLEMLRFVEGLGVKVFSRPEQLLRLIDRLACTITLCAADVPMPPTVITERVDRAVDAVLEFEGAILKPLYSTKARGMRLVEPGSREEVEKEVCAFQDEGNPVMYVQKRLDMPDRDLGLVFVGGRHLGTYARVGSSGSWNTTTRDGGYYAAHAASEGLIELARRAQAPFGLDFTAVDVVETAAGPLVFEVSAFGGFRGLSEGPGIDAATAYADYVTRVLRDGR